MAFARYTSAGDLSTRVTLLAPVAAQEPDYGSTAITWSDQGEVWAQVDYPLAAESSSDTQRVHTLSADVRIRWRADVLPTWRVRIAGQTFDLLGLSPTGRRQWLDLRCAVQDNRG